MTVNQDISFIKYSQNAANFVISFDRLYYSVRKFCNKMVAIALLIPVLIAGYVFLRYINRKLRRKINRDIELTYLNYKDLKRTQLKLNEIAYKLNDIKNIDTKNIPFVFRRSFKQVRKLSIYIDKYRNALNLKINSLNNADKGIFKVRKENDLWKSRIPVYDYLA